jgi:hypothetical protein
MTDPTAPVFTPDPREAKLPVWVREQLQSYRKTITDLHQAVTVLQGQNAGSNVVLVGKYKMPDTPLPKNSSIAFKSNWGRIQVFHDLKGRVHIQGDNTILVRPGGGNNLTIELEDNS